MSSPARIPHLQGLQIDDGTLCSLQAGRLWLVAFMVREAILIAPDNLVPAEETFYFTSIARFIKASLDLEEAETQGEKHPMPYLVRACMDTFNMARAAKAQLGKSTFLETLDIDDKLLARRPGLVTSPLKLRTEEVNEFFVNPSTIFWIHALNKIHSNRQAQDGPPLEMPKPNKRHHRAFLWDTVYSDLQFTSQLLWLRLRASLDMVQGDEECRLDPREPPAVDDGMEIDPSPNALISEVHNKSTGKSKELGDPPTSGAENMNVDHPHNDAVSPDTVQPQGKPKRPRQSGGNEAMEGAETRRSISPTPPTKKSKIAHTDPKPSDDASSCSRQGPSPAASAQPDKGDSITAERREQVQRVGVASSESMHVDSQPSGDTLSSALESTHLVSQSSKADEVTARPRQKTHPAEVIQRVADSEGTLPVHRAIRTAPSESDDSQASGDEESAKDPAQDPIVIDDSGDDSDEFKPEDHPSPSDREDDQIDADPTDEDEDEKVGQPPKKVVKKPPPMPIESFDEPRYNLPQSKIAFDPFSLCLPLIWFFLHPFAKQIFEEQWAPYACITCLRLGIPCVVNLGSFVGCYSCKRRGQACSLKPRVGKEKMTNMKLCWWLGLMHHIQSIIELGTSQGPIGTIPNYGTTNILIAQNIPDWVPAAAVTFRKRMSAAEVAKRWTYLQNNVIPKWHFYAMPHSALAKLGTARPVRPFWPDTGDNKATIENAIQILEAGRKGTLPRLFAINVQDGFDYHETIKKAPKQSKPKDKKQPKGKDGAAEPHDVDGDVAQRPNTRASKSKKKARSPVPSQTDPDEAPVTDLEPAPSFTDEMQDESVMPQSPLPVEDRNDEPMEVEPTSISGVRRSAASHVVPNAASSRDSEPRVGQRDEASISAVELRSAIADVQSSIKAALTNRQANNKVLPDILEKLQKVEVRSMFGKNGMMKGMGNLDHRMNVFCTDMSALQQHVVAQGRELAKASKNIDALNGVLRTQQELLNRILETLKDIPTSADVSALKQEVAAIHNHIDRSSTNMHTHFNGVAERIAFTDRERDILAGGQSGSHPQPTTFAFSGLFNDPSSAAFIEEYTESRMEIEPATSAQSSRPQALAVNKPMTTLTKSRDLPPSTMADAAQSPPINTMTPAA